jgi:hypothetical protein
MNKNSLKLKLVKKNKQIKNKALVEAFTVLLKTWIYLVSQFILTLKVNNTFNLLEGECYQ